MSSFNQAPTPFSQRPTGGDASLYGRIRADLDRIEREVDQIAAGTQDLLARFNRETAEMADELYDRLDAANRRRVDSVAELRRRIGWPSGETA